MTADHIFTPIGYIRCKEQYKYEQPRQGILQSAGSMLELLPKQNFEQALQDLSGFEYIWLIYVFHQNTGWKPLVNPPRLTSGRKIGLFATRSPYRPNPIGMSCVKLEKIDGLKIHISGSDLLDGTPVLDIKPYITYSDAMPDAKQGWLEEIQLTEYQLNFDKYALQKIEWLETNSRLSIKSFLETQLKMEPLSKRRKRIKTLEDQSYLLSYRTWRIVFSISGRSVTINDLYSGYTDSEVASLEDKYADKNLHLRFRNAFPG